MAEEVVGQVDGLSVPRFAGLATFARLPQLGQVPDHAVAVLVKDTTDHILERKRKHELPVRIGPIGNGETGASARYHSPRNY